MRENFKTAPWFTGAFLLAAAGAAFAGDAPPELKDLSVKVSRDEGVGPAMVPQLQDLAVKVSRAKPDIYYAISPPNPYDLPQKASKKDAKKEKNKDQRTVTPSGQVQLKKLKEAKKKPKKIVTGSGRIQLKKIEESKKKADQINIEAEAFYLPAELQDLSLTVSRAKPKAHYAINPPNPNTLPEAPSRQDMLKKLRDARQSRDDLNKNRRLAAPRVVTPSGDVQTPGMQDMRVFPPLNPFGVGMEDTDQPDNPCSGVQGGSNSTPHSEGESTTPGGASGLVTTPSVGGPARRPMRPERSRGGGGGDAGEDRPLMKE